MTTHNTTHNTTPECTICGGFVQAYQTQTEYDGATVHARCITACHSCGDVVPSAETSYVLDRGGIHVRLCHDCVDDNAWRCDLCDLQCTHDVSGHDDDEHGTVCEDCAETIEGERRARVIGSYHNGERRAQTRVIPSPWTRQHGHRALGVELEVERRDSTDDECVDIASALLAAANTERRLLWAEHDGSLNDGFELITQPMGLDGHVELWSRVLRVSATQSLRSHDTRTCGLHVHVSRTGLSALQISKMVAFLNDARSEMLVRAIARRYDSGYCKRKRVTRVADTRYGDRYELLNITPTNTVEVRAFRGTMRAETVLACVEFTNALVEWARNASWRALTVESFLRHVYESRNARDTRHLRQYFARRVTTRLSPRFVALRDLITNITGTAPVAPSDSTNTCWSEI